MVTYTPVTNFTGTDSFTFKSSDGLSDSRNGTVMMQVINTVPVANNQTVEASANKSISISLSGFDQDNDLITLSLLSNPSHGNLSSFVPYNGNGAASAEVIYTPVTNFTGTDSFTFKASDGLSDSSSTNGIVTINVAQHAPIAFNQSLIVSHDKPVDINLFASDQDNDPLTYFLLSNPLHGNLTSFNQTSGKVTYMPGTNFTGTDSALLSKQMTISWKVKMLGMLQ